MIPRRPINEAAHNDSWLPHLHLCRCTPNRRLRLSSRHGGAGAATAPVSRDSRLPLGRWAPRGGSRWQRDPGRGDQSSNGQPALEPPS